MTKHYDIAFYGVAIALAIMCALMFICSSQKIDLKEQLDKAIVQNVQLTKDVREAKADAFRDGLITCGNEDVAYLNERADYYQELAGANPLSKLMREWAQTWTYDDDTMAEMVEDYMDGDSH